MAGLAPGDPQLVSMIVNHLKTQGLFDQFRRECLADVDTKPAYLNLKQRVDNFVSNHLSNHTWSPQLNKNQLRNNIRQLVLQSGMLEQGVDRIVAQVVDPKINHIFRPQVERVVRQFLEPGSCVDEPDVLPSATEPTTLEQATAPFPPTDKEATAILDTITNLSQEVKVKGPKAEPSEEPMDIDANDKDSSRVEDEESIQVKTQAGPDRDMDKEKLTSKVQDPELKSENNAQPGNDKEEVKEEMKMEEDVSDGHNETMEEKDKSTTKAAAKMSAEKQDEEQKSSTQAKQKARERIKEEYSLEDSDLDGLSDITVSSVHTSDLSSFEDESDDGQTPSDSSEEGEIQDDENTNEAGEEGEEKQKPRRKAYVHKPFLYSRYYSDSDDEVTVEERRRSVAKDKEDRLLKRQQNRERMEERRKQKATQNEEQNKKNSKSADATEHPRAKEARKEQKVLEKKMALNRKRKLDSRKEEDVTSKKKETGEGAKKVEVKPASSKTLQQKLSRRMSESASSDEKSRRASGSVPEEAEPKKTSDKNRMHSFILELEQGSQEALKYRSVSKFDRPSRKELVLKERKEKDRHQSNQRPKLKQKQADPETAQKESTSVKEDKKARNKTEKRIEKDTAEVSSKEVKKVKVSSAEHKSEKEKIREKDKDKAKVEKAKVLDTKQLVRLESGGSSEDKSDLDPVSDVNKKKDKHPKEVLKRMKSHSDEKTKSKDAEKEKAKTSDPQKSTKSAHESEKDSKKSKIAEKDKSKAKSKEDCKNLSKIDKRTPSVSASSPNIKADATKEKKKMEGKKEQRKEDKLEVKSLKKKTDKRDVEDKDDNRKEKSSKLEKETKSEEKKKTPVTPETNPGLITSTATISDETTSDVTPEPSESETDSKISAATIPAEADALLALMSVCTAADARLPAPVVVDVAQREADMKDMKEAALTLLSMDPESATSGLVGQAGNSGTVEKEVSRAEEEVKPEITDLTDVSEHKSTGAPQEETPLQDQGIVLVKDETPAQEEEETKHAPLQEDVTAVEAKQDAAHVEVVEEKSATEESTMNTSEQNDYEAEKKSAEEQKETTVQMDLDKSASDVETKQHEDVPAAPEQSEPLIPDIVDQTEMNVGLESKLLKEPSLMSSTDSQEERDSEKEEKSSRRGRRKRKCSTRNLSESGDGKESEKEENVEAKTPRRGRSSRTEESETSENIETPTRKGRRSAATAKLTTDDPSEAVEEDVVSVSENPEKEKQVEGEAAESTPADAVVSAAEHSGSSESFSQITDANTVLPDEPPQHQQQLAEDVLQEAAPLVQDDAEKDTGMETEGKQDTEQQEDTEDEKQEEQDTGPKRSTRRGRPKASTEDSDTKEEDSATTPCSLIKKAQQRMYFLRQLRKAKLPAQMLVQFYTAIIESILTSSITVWFAGATVRDKQRLQRIVRSAEEVIGRSLPSLQDLSSSGGVGGGGGTRGRKRESSPPVVRTRGAQKSEELPSKRAKR
uniref:Biorientation of chromosomes in cell division protein 1-like 1 n=1 Tax=Knipowitschia caucasica TaxID=637954 RepID=A0AAV2MIE0_KNICA